MLRALLLACLWLLSLSALGQVLTVTDSIGREITLPTPARRIVTLAPHLAENVFSAGAGHYLVGVASYSDFPESARELPEVGDFNAFSLERIAELQPDLILLWASGNGLAALERLAPLGVPVYVDEIRELDQIPQSIRAIGLLAGTQASSASAAQAFERDIGQLQQAHSDLTRLSVFYQIWHQPLQTVGGEHLISQLIALCGGQNLFQESTSLAPRITLEAVLAGDPEVIIGSGMAGQRPPWLDDWRRFPSLRAVAGDQLRYIHADVIQRPTLRILEGARAMCAILDQARAQQALSSSD